MDQKADNPSEPTFADLGLHDEILKSLTKISYEKPSPIQIQAIPPIMQGKDLIALAKTGSGKTAACAIPLCQHVDVTRPVIQALVLVPTRELALQFASETQRIGNHRGVKVFAMYGGEDSGLQQEKLKLGVQILIATPGRLIDFVYNRQIDLSEVDILVLDEADEMFSMGFYDDIEFIIQCLVHKHQTLLFSATMPKAISKLASNHMHEPHEIKVDPPKTSPTTIKHRFLFCKHHEKTARLLDLLAELSPHQSIIFCRSRNLCEDVCKALKQKIKDVDFLHGGLSQDVRNIVTDKFRKKRVRHLCATDVAARGLDFAGISHVFILEISEDLDVHIHRSGRTGRFEREGMAISFVTPRELGRFKQLIKILNCKPDWIGKAPDLTKDTGNSKYGYRKKAPARGRRGPRPPK